jgi:hypothetical protein
MISNIYKFIFFILVILFSLNEVNSQCCSAGNPFFYGELSSVNSKTLQVITGYKYSTSNQYYSGSTPEDINFIEKAYFNYQTLQFVYGITNRLTAQADIGYFYNKTENYSDVDWTNSSGSGLGDASFSLKYLIYQNWRKQFRIIPSLGITLPIGVFDQEVDHVKLPITVQPSSGSFKYQLGLLMTKSSNKNKFSYSFFGLFEYAQLINSRNFYYKYGNQYLFSIMASYKFNHQFSFALEGRSENRAKSFRENNQIVESSGYNIAYLIPHISWAFHKNWSLAINTDIPVYRYYNGIQLANAFSFSTRLSFKLNFEKSKLENFEPQ